MKLHHFNTGKIFALIIIALTLSNCIKKEKKSGQTGLDVNEFKEPSDNVKLHTWWHWVESSITRDGITKDLEAMKAQGIVQATILNVGLSHDKDFGVPKVQFNTEKWYDMYSWALQEANRLGIKIGAHNCDGWSSSGGPWITPEQSMKQYVWTKSTIDGGKEISVSLPKPFAKLNFYKDVAVVAFKTDVQKSSFQEASPEVLLNDTLATASLTDGNPVSDELILKKNFIKIKFKEPFTAQKIVLHPRKAFMWSNPADFTSQYSLWASDDNKKFKKVKDFEIKGVNISAAIELPEIKARFFKLEFADFANSDSWLPFGLAEMELLKKDESPLYNTSIPFLQEKTVSVKAADKKALQTGSDSKTGIDDSQVIDLTDKMDASGNLKWTAPEGKWAILRFGYTTTASKNGPATPMGEGLECDKMDTSIVSYHFSQYPQKLIDKAGKLNGNTFKFLLIDSWECNFQNWTGSLPSEFEKRRGYSIIKWLPVLCGEVVQNGQQTEAFLYDYRKTIADLIEDNYFKHFANLCHKNNLEMHAEVIYGTASYPPLDILKTNSYADMPMFEFWAGHNGKTKIPEYTATLKPSLDFPESAALFYDKQVFGSEAYTAMAHYSESPWDLKSFGDRAYCTGINQMILHSYVHQPTDTVPGMTLGPFASHFNRNNGFFQFISPWFNYQARIQSVLQKGTMQADVLAYVGDQLPQYNDPDRSPAGYNTHICNFDILKNKINVKDGKLNFKDGNSFSLLTLPNEDAMELATLQRIEILVNEGAALYGPKPLHTYSKSNSDENNKALVALTAKLWGGIDGKSVTENAYGKGRVFWGISVGEALNRIALKPDFQTTSADTLAVMYVHRKVNNADVYFVFNQRDVPLNTECSFRVTGKTPEIWDPNSGTIVKPSIFNDRDGRISIPVSFGPKESFIFVFNNEKPDNYITGISKDGKVLFPANGSSTGTLPFGSYENGKIVLAASETGSYECTFNSGTKSTINVKPKETKEITDLTGEISFETSYKSSIQPVKISSLGSLSEFQDPAIKYFSGRAKYTLQFKLPEGFDPAKDSIYLSIGKFEAAGTVSLNGKPLAKVWSPDYWISASNALKADNTLEITVANGYRNRIIGDFAEYGTLKNVWTSSVISDFLQKDTPLKTSGLVGSIKLMKAPKNIVTK